MLSGAAGAISFVYEQIVEGRKSAPSKFPEQWSFLLVRECTSCVCMRALVRILCNVCL